MPLDKQWSLQFTGYKSDSNVATIGGTNVLGKGYSFGMSAIYTLAPQGDWYNSCRSGWTTRSSTKPRVSATTKTAFP